MQIDWTYIQQHWDWAGHIVEALVMAGVVALIWRITLKWKSALIVGLAFAIGHFHGREKRDYEVSVHMPPPHLRGYYIWDWNWDQATDFWPAALVCSLLLFLISRRHEK
jgi:MFS superfamily sulfate permease-like transporter